MRYPFTFCACFWSAPAALSSHPLVAFLARQLLSDCVAAAGSSELATQQLGLLHKLLGASAAVAAVPGASWSADSRQSAEAIVDALAAVLQVSVATNHCCANAPPGHVLFAAKRYLCCSACHSGACKDGSTHARGHTSGRQVWRQLGHTTPTCAQCLSFCLFLCLLRLCNCFSTRLVTLHSQWSGSSSM